MARGHQENSGRFHRESETGPAKKKKKTPSVPRRPINRATTEPTDDLASTEQAEAAPIPLALQQSVLDVFSSAFKELNPSHADSAFHTLLQEVKGHLYNRDFETAFGRREYLEVYAVRWSASRALGYLDVLKETFDHLLPAAEHQDDAPSSDSLSPGETEEATRKIINIVSLGGGVAELGALAGIHRLQSLLNEDTASPSAQAGPSFNVTLLDSADWSPITSAVTHSLTHSRPTSPYASASAKAAALIPIIPPSQLNTAFIQTDLLSPSPAPASNPTYDMADLITLAFTLNELYTTSVPKTQNLLLSLTAAMEPGALLLVIDSPGSYSTVTINGSEKRYPMHWLLEHTLLKVAPEALGSPKDGETSAAHEGNDRVGTAEAKTGDTPFDGAQVKGGEKALWECVSSTPSRWFRLPAGLKYPLELENMRYQMHLYRRV